MFSVLIFSLTFNLSSGFNPDSTKVVSTELVDTSYAENIRIADSLFVLSDFRTAQQYYQTALALKLNDARARRGINDCTNLTNCYGNGMSLNYQFDKILNKANEYFDTLNYLCARDYYIRAEALRPNDVFVKERIAVCNKNLDGVAVYKACIKEGDVCFAKENYQSAKGFYMRALTIGGDADEYLKSQIIFTNEKLREQSVREIESQYQLILNKADEYFQAGNYQKAKDLYSRAVLLKPTDTFAQERLKICDEKLKN